MKTGKAVGRLRQHQIRARSARQVDLSEVVAESVEVLGASQSRSELDGRLLHFQADGGFKSGAV